MSFFGYLTFHFRQYTSTTLIVNIKIRGLSFLGYFLKNIETIFQIIAIHDFAIFPTFSKSFRYYTLRYFQYLRKVRDIKSAIFNIAKTDYVIIFELKKRYIYWLVLWFFRPVVKSLFQTANRLSVSIIMKRY